MDGETSTLLRKKHVALLSTIIWLFLLKILEKKTTISRHLIHLSWADYRLSLHCGIEKRR